MKKQIVQMINSSNEQKMFQMRKKNISNENDKIIVKMNKKQF